MSLKDAEKARIEHQVEPDRSLIFKGFIKSRRNYKPLFLNNERFLLMYIPEPVNRYIKGPGGLSLQIPKVIGNEQRLAYVVSCSDTKYEDMFVCFDYGAGLYLSNGDYDCPFPMATLDSYNIKGIWTGSIEDYFGAFADNSVGKAVFEAIELFRAEKD